MTSGPQPAPARPSTDEALLAPYRVLDLCGLQGALCGTIMARMGADVIQIEPVGGSEIRDLAPFAEDRRGPDSSLYWWALGSNKRSVALDIETPGGRAILLDLVRSADFLVEAFAPGYLDGLGLGYEQLREVAPSLVYVSITPYGQYGPRSHWAASDINIQGMGGHMYLTGDVDRAPLRVGVPAAYWHGGGEAVAGAMIAHHHRRRTGQGQHVDVSMQQCVIWTLLNTTMTWQMLRRQEMRGGAVRKERSNIVYTRVVWPCADGHIVFIPIGGGGGAARTKSYLRFVDWVAEEGGADPRLTARDWNDKDAFNFSQEEYDEVAGLIGDFLATRTVAELYQRAVDFRLLIAPVSDVADLLESPQLNARDFFTDVRDPQAAQPHRHPGAFAKFSASPLLAPAMPPRIGEHTDVILAELGYGPPELSALRAEGVI